MSEGNLELVRRSFEAFVAGDFETAFAAYHPRAEWTTAGDEPDTRTYSGIDEIRRLARSFAEPWENRFDRAVVPEEYIDLGDWIVVPTSGRLHGKGSGIEVDIIETYAVQVRDGRIIRVDEYRTRDQAIQAVQNG
ncbi:MAG TPA: nuclear transport factor 2 family protein [Thermoleophilaceae bacterium]|nr:nuclear transport factor 2 family protein [Thermoleophilaceae bacterium]